MSGGVLRRAVEIVVTGVRPQDRDVGKRRLPSLADQRLRHGVGTTRRHAAGDLIVDERDELVRDADRDLHIHPIPLRYCVGQSQNAAAHRDVTTDDGARAPMEVAVFVVPDGPLSTDVWMRYALVRIRELVDKPRTELTDTEPSIYTFATSALSGGEPIIPLVTPAPRPVAPRPAAAPDGVVTGSRAQRGVCRVCGAEWPLRGAGRPRTSPAARSAPPPPEDRRETGVAAGRTTVAHVPQRSAPCDQPLRPAPCDQRVGSTRPRTSPSSRRPPPTAGAVAVMTTSSPSSR